MDTVPVVPAASNAAPADYSVRRTASHLTSPPAPIVFPCKLTEELFQRWLDLHPGRRAGHERRPEKDRENDRRRVARMYALRACDISVAFANALATAQKLHDQLQEITRFYGPNEAERVLKAAGVPLPDRHEIGEGYDGETFADAHAACVKMLHRTEKFIGRIDPLQYVLPDGDPEDLCASNFRLVPVPEVA